MKEFEIRPALLFDRYLELSRNDVSAYFGTRQNRTFRKCPACDQSSSIKEFEKNTFTFVRCADCQTLYVNPCPDPNQLAKFYCESPSQIFWANSFFPKVAAIRRKKIFIPRAKAIKALLLKHQINQRGRIIDVGAGDGTMLKEMEKTGLGDDVVAVEPTPDLAKCCEAKGFTVFNGFAETASKEKSLVNTGILVTSFEVIEHLVSPADFLMDLSIICNKEGVILITGLSGSGFDIQVLGKKSKAISPPHHLNFITRRGVTSLLERCGLQEISFTTPGKLDVDIVRNSFIENSSAVSDPFLHQLFKEDDEGVLVAFQKFLSLNHKSSHMWILARKLKA